VILYPCNADPDQVARLAGALPERHPAPGTVGR